MKFICVTCNKEFVRYDRRTSGRFCGVPCWNQYRRDHPKPNNCVCEICGKGFRLKPASIKQGMGKYCSRECKHTAQRDMAKKVDNETYLDRHILRQSSLYKKWRSDALKLHEAKCDSCGVAQHSMCECCGTKIYLEIHHVEKFSKNVERRFEPTNSSVLCPKCHRAVEIIGVSSVDTLT